MNLRTVYAIAISIFALFTGYYALMTLAFFFGEGSSEWLFPAIITAVAALTIWTAVGLWRGKDARWLSAASLIVVAAVLGWIVIPPGTWDAPFAGVVLAFAASLALLVGLFSEKVRKSLA